MFCIRGLNISTGHLGLKVCLVHLSPFIMPTATSHSDVPVFSSWESLQVCQHARNNELTRLVIDMSCGHVVSLYHPPFKGGMDLSRMVEVILKVVTVS